MLAKDVNDNAGFLNKRGACEFFASKLAPTGGQRLPPAHIWVCIVCRGLFAILRGLLKP